MRLAASARQAGYRLNSFEQLGSTNDEALARAGAGDRGRLWIAARVQRAGRGRQGRTWASPEGNLYASLLLVDAVAPAKAAQLSVVAGVALAEAVETVLEGAGRITIKWPNDILVGDAKLGGILVEATRAANGVFAVVIGFGVNCVSHPDGLSYPTTDLTAIGTAQPSRSRLFEALSDRMAERVATWDGGGDFGAIRSLWLERAVPVGTRLSVSAGAARLAGSFETMDSIGRLVLSTPAGLLTVEAGDVMVTDRQAAIG